MCDTVSEQDEAAWGLLFLEPWGIWNHDQAFGKMLTRHMALDMVLAVVLSALKAQALKITISPCWGDRHL